MPGKGEGEPPGICVHMSGIKPALAAEGEAS